MKKTFPSLSNAFRPFLVIIGCLPLATIFAAPLNEAFDDALHRDHSLFCLEIDGGSSFTLKFDAQTGSDDKGGYVFGESGKASLTWTGSTRVVDLDGSYELDAYTFRVCSTHVKINLGPASVDLFGVGDVPSKINEYTGNLKKTDGRISRLECRSSRR